MTISERLTSGPVRNWISWWNIGKLSTVRWEPFNCTRNFHSSTLSYCTKLIRRRKSVGSSRNWAGSTILWPTPNLTPPMLILWGWRYRCVVFPITSSLISSVRNMTGHRLLWLCWVIRDSSVLRIMLWLLKLMGRLLFWMMTSLCRILKRRRRQKGFWILYQVFSIKRRTILSNCISRNIGWSSQAKTTSTPLTKAGESSWTTKLSQ